MADSIVVDGSGFNNMVVSRQIPVFCFGIKAAGRVFLFDGKHRILYWFMLYFMVIFITLSCLLDLRGIGYSW